MGSARLLAAILQPNSQSDSDIFACFIDDVAAFVAIFVTNIASLLYGVWVELPARIDIDPTLLSHGRRCCT
jgi:hypothetical protein